MLSGEPPPPQPRWFGALRRPADALPDSNPKPLPYPTPRSQAVTDKADTVERLKAVREMLAYPGAWTKGEYFRKGGQWCLAGACITADVPMRAWALLRDVVNEKHAVDGPTTIEGFNDRPATTLADVLIVLDLAIDRAVGES